MIVRITKALAEEIGPAKFKAFGLDDKAWSWKEVGEIDLATRPVDEVKQLDALMAKHGSVRGTKIVRQDIAVWLGALKSSADAKARSVEQFASLATRYLLKSPGHRVFEQAEADSKVWLCYYVNRVIYHLPNKGTHGSHPAYTEIELVHEEFGGQKLSDVCFYADDCIGYRIAEALARKSLYVEMPDMRTTYLVQVDRFSGLTGQIGLQLWAEGTGTDDLDGNTSRESSWYWKRTNVVALVRGGQPSRVVVDVFYEDQPDREKRVHIDEFFWHRHMVIRSEDESDDDVDEKIIADVRAERPEIPIHPKLAVFDLSKHLRLRVHVNYLTPYGYDTALAEKLILPAHQKGLVKLLVESKAGGFVDVVRGKSGGAVVLLSGPPGTGKTLTAEVYAEAEQRALYSVQCSQLGTDPTELEDELLKVFARAKRWNAVLLLDEADVYVHERGNDLQQNAIVGVFLRVVEYQGSTMFLTTNRPDDVDDAIASRCVARLNYAVPTPEEQRRIWQVLSESSGIAMKADQIDIVVDTNRHLSGRDVKNLLKLAALTAGSRAVTAQDVEYVKQFKPTTTAEEAK